MKPCRRLIRSKRMVPSHRVKRVHAMEDMNLMPASKERARESVDVRGIATKTVTAKKCGNHAKLQRGPPCLDPLNRTLAPTMSWPNSLPDPCLITNLDEPPVRSSTPCFGWGLIKVQLCFDGSSETSGEPDSLQSAGRKFSPPRALSIVRYVSPPPNTAKATWIRRRTRQMGAIPIDASRGNPT